MNTNVISSIYLNKIKQYGNKNNCYSVEDPENPFGRAIICGQKVTNVPLMDVLSPAVNLRTKTGEWRNSFFFLFFFKTTTFISSIFKS